MAEKRLREKHTDVSSSYLINELISAANTNDRFNLLEDDTILPANLTNPIHPLFRQLESDDRLHLALQLASHFLLHDRLLEFFVPLLYGRETHDLRSSKNYLCDPLVHSSKAKRAILLTSVRKALECLADQLEIRFLSQRQQVWARTILDKATTTSTASCCGAFKSRKTPRIELTERFSQFYYAADGYVVASRCAQFRHDFLFATTLVHEVVHAVGVMRRGNLIEPHYRLNFPEAEWGYAWENFMFGSIINPQDKTKPGTHILMRKVWADAKTANAKGGKEYSDVAMSWVAQWFRTETWTTVAQKGPTAIAPARTHFKIQISQKHGAWIVSADCSAVREDIAALYTQWQMPGHRFEAKDCSSDRGRISDSIRYNSLNESDLQMPNVPVPQRLRDSPKPSTIQRMLLADKLDTKKPSSLALEIPAINVTTVAAHRESLICGTRRKRFVSENDDFLPRVRRRIR